MKKNKFLSTAVAILSICLAGCPNPGGGGNQDPEITGFTWTPSAGLQLVAGAVEAGYTVGVFSAPEGGTAPFAYTLVDGEGNADNALFTIVGTNLKVGSAALTEARQYSLRVQIGDSKGKSFAKICTFEVAAAAYSEPSGFTFTPEEGLQLGTGNVDAGDTVGSFSAPVGGTAPFSYTLVEGEGSLHNAFFVIDGVSLKVGEAALTEARSYSVRVQVEDAVGSTFAKICTLTVALQSGITQEEAIPLSLNLWSDKKTQNYTNTSTYTWYAYTPSSAGNYYVHANVTDGGLAILVNKEDGTTVNHVDNHWAITTAMQYRGYNLEMGNIYYIGLRPYDTDRSPATFTVAINQSSIPPVILDYTESDGMISITGYTGSPIENLIIPASINGKPVTRIGSSAFEGCSGLISIAIPDSVTSIGSLAFADCSGLTSITIPGSVTSIGDSAFSGCSGLTSVTIADGVTSIEIGAFYGCSGLISIAIPDSVTSIGSLAFAGCSGLTSITIPGSVTSIELGAFNGCSGLTSVTIPGSVSYIGSVAFSGCSGLTSVTIPGSVTNIGDSAFSGCSGLTSVTIADGVTSIGYRAFNECSGLTSVTIPSSVTSIQEYVFLNCGGLTSINVNGDNKNYSSEEGILYNKNKFVLLYYPSGKNETSITIPRSVISIGIGAFNGCSGLTSVTIPGSVSYIGNGAFNGCSGLTSVTFGAVSSSIQIADTSSFPGNLKSVYNTAGTYMRDNSSDTTWSKVL
jgi:hypothetical protein